VTRVRVYADVFVLLNTGADWALLVAAARLCGVRAPAWRLLAAAALGGIYGVGALLSPALASLPATAAAALVMAAAAFAPRPLRVLVRLLASLYGAAALAAGLAWILVPRGDTGVPWWALTLGLGAALCAGGALFERWRPGAPLQSLCDLEIEIAGRTARCRALIDTGSHLADPAGEGPAVVVAPGVLRGLVPPRVLKALASGPEALPEALAEPAVPAEDAAEGRGRPAGRPAVEWARRVRLLPYRTLGTPRGLLCGLRPDAISLLVGGERRPIRAVVAVSPAPLDPDGGYAALVPAVLAVGEAGLQVAAAQEGRGRPEAAARR
jgi:stage II sporulation protein GA (sporulation sigma-E factor processing peptidase)